MKSLTLTAAAASVAFGALVLAGAISLGSDRADRWAVIGAFGALMLCFGVLTATKDSERRTSSARGLPPQPDPIDLPAAPGSLHGRVTPKTPVAPALGASTDLTEEPVTTPFGLVQFQPGVPVGRFENSGEDEDPFDLDVASLDETAEAGDAHLDEAPERLDAAPEAADEYIVDLTQIDDVEPLTDHPLARSSSDSRLPDVGVDQVVDTVFTDDDPWDLDHADAINESETRSSAASLSLLDADRVTAPLHLGEYSDDDLKAIVMESEATVIRSMIASGRLSSSGALTERDVATMIFLAYTSSDMLTELRLRKVTSQPLLHSRAEIA